MYLSCKIRYTPHIAIKQAKALHLPLTLQFLQIHHPHDSVPNVFCCCCALIGNVSVNSRLGNFRRAGCPRVDGMIYTTAAADAIAHLQQICKHGCFAFLHVHVQKLLPSAPSLSAAYYCLRRVDSASLLVHYWWGARVEQSAWTFEPKADLTGPLRSLITSYLLLCSVKIVRLSTYQVLVLCGLMLLSVLITLERFV